MSELDAPATQSALAALPSLPRDNGEPVFAEPWQAQAFALAVRLSADGHFTWNVASLVFDGQSVWFHSVNTPDVARLIFDYIDAMIGADGYLPPPSPLVPHVFSFYDWERRRPRPG